MQQTDLVPLWKALADAKRRRIIHLLADNTLTTSEICAYFDVSRFAIMRHLKVLEQTGLIQTRREGRQRWNFLNKDLFQQIEQTYLDNQTNGDKQLADILNFLTRQEGESVKEMAVSERPPIELEVMLQATPHQVFQALTDNIDAWWSYRIMTDSQVCLEPLVGGRFFEAFCDGGGALYAIVTYINPHEEIRLTGSMGLTDSSVNHAIHLTWQPKRAEETHLQLRHHFMNKVNGITVETFKRSWLELLEQQLKSFIEERNSYQASGKVK